MKIAIIGRSELLYNTARKLMNEGHEITCIITAKEAPEYFITAEDYRKLAHELNIPFAIGSKISDYSDLLRKSGSEVAISINYSGVIPQNIIDIFPVGILNAHGGDLPRYRGNACQAWAIINGESRIGLCIHKMIGGELDSGDIVAREYYPIDINTSVTEIWDWMINAIPQLMSNSVRLLNADPNYVLEAQSKDHRDALRCYPRVPEDGRIEWKESSISIIRLIKASSMPYSGAYCDFNGKKMTIWNAEIINDEEKYCAIPGQVVKIGESYVDVACGVGKLRLREISIEAERVPPSCLIKSIRVRLR